MKAHGGKVLKGTDIPIETMRAYFEGLMGTPSRSA